MNLSADKARELIKREEVGIELAPASRVGIAEVLHLKPPFSPKIQHAFLKLGCAGVFETPLGADLVAWLESREVWSNRENAPFFTSCCVGWRNAAKGLMTYGRISPYISPQMLVGLLIKRYFKAGKKVLAVMPCGIKFMETKYVFDDCERYVDYVITSVEAAKLIKDCIGDERNHIETCFCSRAGMGFGASGGVVGAVLAYLARERSLTVRGESGKEGYVKIEVEIDGEMWSVYRLWGFANIRTFFSCRPKCLFAEMMSCRLGCVGGMGQPRVKPTRLVKRAEELREIANALPETLFDIPEGRAVIEWISNIPKEWLCFPELMD